jgi:hypothetical protein
VLSTSPPDPLSADCARVRHDRWRRGGTRSWGVGGAWLPPPPRNIHPFPGGTRVSRGCRRMQGRGQGRTLDDHTVLFSGLPGRISPCVRGCDRRGSRTQATSGRRPPRWPRRVRLRGLPRSARETPRSCSVAGTRKNGAGRTGPPSCKRQPNPQSLRWLLGQLALGRGVGGWLWLASRLAAAKAAHGPPSPCRRSEARCAPGGGPPDQSPS